MDNLTNLLKNFGFTESETKVYQALLKYGPETGYEASKNSSVPRSKIYNILENLINKGCVVVTKRDKPVNYAAVAADELIEKIRHNVDGILDEVKLELENYDNKIDMEQVWHIKGYDNIFAKCRSILASAEEEIYIQIWKDDIKEIENELIIKEKELQEFITILYSMDQDYEVGLKNFYKHGFEKEKLSETGGRWLTLVVDSKEMMFGNIQNEKNAEVIWTQSSPMIFLAKENIKHDAYCLRLIEKLGESAKDKFGKDLEGIRDIFINH